MNVKSPECPLGEGWFKEAGTGHAMNIGRPLNLKQFSSCCIYQVEKHKTGNNFLTFF